MWRRWRVWTFGGVGLLALGVLVPMASAWVRQDGPVPLLPAAVAPEIQPEAVVVRFRDGAGTDAVTSRGGRVLGELAGTGFVRVKAAGDPATLVAQLRTDPAVAEVALDYPRLLAAVPNDTYYATYQQDDMALVRLPAAWDIIKDASSQVVAVIDTGVVTSHPDLAGRLVPGYNVLSPSSPPTDTHGHGTLVAGIIAANANNGVGIAGATWNGRVMPIKVAGGSGSPGTAPVAFDSDIAVGIVWAVDHGARVVNLSLYNGQDSPLLHDAVRYATDRDVVVVAASGNSASGTAQYPAAFPEVIAVGATDAAGALFQNSSYGPWLDLAAPGFDVISTYTSDYIRASGTSFAAPLVAGVAALVRAKEPALSQAQVGDRLRAAARDAGPRGVDPYYGWGVLDAARALGAAKAADLAFPSLGAGEPNDTVAHAVALPAGVATSATLAVSGDVDWYRYQATSSQTISVSLTAPPFSVPANGHDIDPIVIVYDKDLVQIKTLLPGNSSPFEVPEGNVYLKVVTRNGTASTASYSIKVTLGGTALDYYVQTFDFGTPTVPGTTPAAIAIGDVTGDGQADIVGTTKQFLGENVNDHKVFVLPGPAFSTAVWGQPALVTVPSLTLADVNRDGRLDVVVAGNGGINWLTWNAGALVSQNPLLAGGSYSYVTAGNVSGDSGTDLVALTAPSNGLDVLTHGTGSTFTKTTIPNSTDVTTAIAVGDVGGEAAADVVSVSGTSIGDLVVFYQGSAGAWTRNGVPAAGGSFQNLSSLAIADVTNDSKLDVVGTVDVDQPSGAVDVFPQGGGVVGAPTVYAATKPHAVAVGDVNGDNRTDVAIVLVNGNAVSLLRQQSNGTLGEPLVLDLAASTARVGPQGLAIGKLDSDNLGDLAVAADGAVAIIRHDPTPPAVPGRVVTSVTPAEYSTGAALSVAPTVVFAANVDASTVNSSNLRLVDGRTGATVPATVSYNGSNRTATITPSQLHRLKPYRIEVSEGVTVGGFPLEPFSSTFTTANGPVVPLQDFAVRGRHGEAATVSFTIPAGDVSDVIVRYAQGTTPPASPTSGQAGYSGVGTGITIAGLTPGQTYSFSVWYGSGSSMISGVTSVTLVGTTLAMTATSSTTTGATIPTVRFSGTVTTPAGAGSGVPVSLVAYCAGGPVGGTVVATATGSASGVLSAPVNLNSPACVFQWEVYNSASYMGGSSSLLRISTGGITPPVVPPRDR